MADTVSITAATAGGNQAALLHHDLDPYSNLITTPSNDAVEEIDI